MSLYRISKKERRQEPLTDRCIILDLDETLIHSCEDYRKLINLRPFQDPSLLDLRKRMYNLYLNGYHQPPTIWGVTRPYTEEFLLFCFDYFSKVCVWSAGLPDYVNKIVDYIFPAAYKPDVVYDRSHCHYTVENDIFKPIERMREKEDWHDIMRLDNTFFVDDRAKAFIKNPGNGIVIPGYEPDGSLEAYVNDDQALLELMDWLMLPEVLEAQDVRQLDKRRIFTRQGGLSSIIK